MPITIEQFLPDEYTYERMQELDSDYTMTFSDFYVWNIKCINELSDEDCEWTLGLCRRIENQRIRLMDEESCASFQAHGLHFNMEGELCIMNPR